MIRRQITNPIFFIFCGILPYVFLPFDVIGLSSIEEIFASFILFAFLSFVAFLFCFLSLSGAFTAAIIGTHIFAVSGFSLFPIFVFFITGSVLSKLKTTVVSDQKSGKPRDGWQVLSNGGIVLIISIAHSITGNDYNILYLISAAVATADTWSSEIGTRFGKKTVDILSFKSVTKGISGGVSMIGIGASIVGAAVIAVFANNMRSAIIIIILGTAGSIIDSIAGSRFQILNKDQSPVDSFRFLTNDGVNFASNLLITLTGLFFL